MKEALLLIFTKNPVLGTVKTRLAKTIGDDKALEVYHSLLEHTAEVTHSLDFDRAIFYNKTVIEADYFKAEFKRVQEGESLGDKMKHAFAWGFDQGYKRVAIVGSDCFDLQTQHLSNAFDALKTTNVVLGPAMDGGFYLLGMNTFSPELFSLKAYSTPRVASETLSIASQLNLSTKELEVLSDIDNEEDLKRYQKTQL